MPLRVLGPVSRAVAAGLSACLALIACGQEKPAGTAEAPPPAPASEPAAAAVTGPATAASLDALTQQAREAFEKSRRAVVRITASDDYGRLAGTGFLIDSNGTIFTAYSVVAKNKDIEVQFDGKKYPARRLFTDRKSGLAAIKINAADMPSLPAGRPSELLLAAPIIVVGYPRDLPVSPSVGFLAGMDWKFEEVPFPTPHLRANVMVQPGEQGAPMLNAMGEVVAILVAGPEKGSACFGLPITAARKVYIEYLRFGRPQPGFIGAEFSPRGGTHDDVGAEAAVTGISPGSPAEKAGLEKGDVLLEIDGLEIRRPADVFSASFFLTGGDPTFVKVRREGLVRTLEVVPVMHPSVLTDDEAFSSSDEPMLYRPLQLRR